MKNSLLPAFISSLSAAFKNEPSGLVNERKFTAHSLDTQRALTLVRHVCVPHPVYPEGRVNSIYFDTPGLASYHEKTEGDLLKRKYRLRWYDVPGVAESAGTVAFLEVKHRIGCAREKFRQAVEANRGWLESAPLEGSCLTRFLYRAARECEDNIPLNLWPAVCISYRRWRFLCPRSGLTVCVDSNIAVSRINGNLFPAVPSFVLNAIVCECKGADLRDIPWADGLYQAGFRIRSFSKYGECVNHILHGGAPTVIRMSI